ncbi:YeiH family protein [Frigidibacter sp. ROC022]|uniref:YeiH family protein n=1 Tax=Frigidibacter sp. ROC022 TaxID=2971796 RepID=UPI00215B1DE6|nr:putative sulfate exporter family transporter [Frigidibacter sp. ROC022]MCR8725297.1 putative sulfate exporter family transporter [Frigidibacter sp. ROC022]
MHNLNTPVSTAARLRALPFLGFLLPAAVAGLAILLHQLPALASVSSMMLAILLGIALRNVAPLPAAALTHTGFLVKHALRLGIVLLGIRITLMDISSLGTTTIVIVMTCVFATFGATLLFGRLLRVPRHLTELIAAGTSICGASAVIAINAVRRGPEEDMAYAIATVTLLGSVAMVAYPLLAGLMGLDPTVFGVWTGATVHEVAQVTAAAYQQGDLAGNVGTVTKLGRVVLLVPVAMGVALSMRLGHREEDGVAGKAPIPWFVLGFLAVVILNSVVSVPDAAHQGIRLVSELLLVLGLAAAGLQAHLASLMRVGLRPLLLALCAWAFIATLGLTMAQLLL